jgi:hypothetical protein
MRKTSWLTIVAVLLLMGTAATMATAAGPAVVAPSGAVAGRDYGDWLKKYWKLIFEGSLDEPPCRHVGRVLVLRGFPQGERTVYRCSVAVGTTVYMNGPSTECSTLEKAPFHGDTKAELKACARKTYGDFIGTFRLFVDGRELEQPERWNVATSVFGFRMPKKNVLNSKKRRGRSAAYGAGYLIKRLARGKHVIKGEDRNDGKTTTVIYRITVGG